MPLMKPQQLLLYSNRFDPDEHESDWFIPCNWRYVDPKSMEPIFDSKEILNKLSEGDVVTLGKEELPGWPKTTVFASFHTGGIQQSV